MRINEVSRLVITNGKDIYNFCIHLTQNKQEAEELYQDIFLKAVELCDRIDINNNPKSYLLSIAIKLWNNRKRKYAWRRRIAAMEYHEDELVYEKCQLMKNLSPEEELLEKEKYEMVAKAVRNLKEEYRVPMYLYYVTNMSLRDIGLILHKPEGTVKSRLHKARKEVKRYLEDNGYGR